jgi:hypothetical protein
MRRPAIRHRSLFVLALLAGAAAATATAAGPAGQEGKPPLPPARAVPGINAPDSFPRGCVDCHVVYENPPMDVRIGTLLQHWCEGADPRLLAAAQAATPAGVTLTGRHPEAAAALADVPGACLDCHGRDATDAPPFGRLMHAVHLADRPDNPFLSMFQGECTHCHKLDAGTGAWTVASGPQR